MHELSVVSALFSTVLESAGKHQAREITLVKIKVGRLSGVVPELLVSAFDMYKKDTIADQAVLEIDLLPFRVRCRACGVESVLDEFIFACPSCGAADLEILQGTELFLEKIEVEID
jgi:hydrogenase nickel incorporation protein HypA/HybF